MSANAARVQDMLLGWDFLSIPEAETDLRQHARIHRKAAVHIELGDDSGPTTLAAELKDLSPAGVGFLCNLAMDAGQRFCMELPLADGQRVTVACRAVNCRPASESVYRIGATFLRTIARPARRQR